MPLSHTGFFLLRSPLYPVNRYKEVMQGNLQELVSSNPLFSYALHIASKDLLNELERFLSNPAEFNQKKIEKLQRSLYKYWVRACTRSTPYGLFAGCTTGMIGAQTKLLLNNMKDARQYTRLDMDYYTKICNHIQQLPAVSSHLKYFANNSIYKTGDQYRYAEYIITNNKRKYLLTAIADSVFIARIIREAANGLTIKETVQLILEEDNTIPEEEATAFVAELISVQLLIPEIEPKVTGHDNLDTLINRLASMEEVQALHNALVEIRQLLQQQDYERTRLTAVHKACETAFPLSPPRDLLQVDLFRTAADCTLSEGLVNDITTQINSLLALCHGYPKGNSELKDFMTRFREQYETQEMPLNKVLDGETGIGYGAGAEHTVHTPFVADLPAAAPADNPPVNWSQLQELAMDKYEQFLRDRVSTVFITDDDLKKMGDAATIKLAPSCYLFGQIIAASAAEADNGNYLFALQSMGGPSAANLLGRFCSGDGVLAEKVHAVLDNEAAAFPDTVLAEIVHFPEARAANVLIRPALRDYEIPYVGVSGAPAACQIPVSDLMVSVKDNEVVLRSKRLDKRVIPRLSAAHNYSFNSLPVYKFLCDLQHQSTIMGLQWDWGVLAKRTHLPRVMYKHIILSKASWIVTSRDLEQAGNDETELLRFFEQYRAKKGMPEQLLIVEADNELLIDLTQPASIRVLLEQVRKSSTVFLKEFVFAEQGGVAIDQEDNVYANEVLIPLSFQQDTDKQPYRSGLTQGVLYKEHVQRSFAPGSEWLYVKIYCGFVVAEKLLAGYFAAQLPEWQESGLFEQFFFIRYTDPQPHIRLRFLNSARKSNNDVILYRLEEALQEYILSGQVKKIQCDTYERELERYGSHTMAFSEQLFCSDSIAVLGILAMLEGAEGEMYRWKIAMRGVDLLLHDFGLTLSRRKQLLASLREAFSTESGDAKLLHKHLNDKYRKHQQEILSFMNQDDDEENGITEVTALFQLRSGITVPIAAVIKQLLEEDAYMNIIASYVHMFLNRIFVVKQRKHELVLYFFLEKYYLSQLALAASLK